MKLIILSCLYALVCATKESETPVHLCGRQLAMARTLVCFGSEYVMKRGLPNSLTPDRLPQDYMNGINWPWGERYDTIRADWARYKRQEGLADRCCSNPCTTSVILEYC